MEFQWRKEASGLALHAGTTRVGTLLGGGSGGSSQDEVTDLGDGVFEVTRRFSPSQPSWPPRLTLDFQVDQQALWAMVPAVSYNGNPWGRGQEPKGFDHGGTPWSFASHRTSVPGATYSQGSHWSVGWFGEPQEGQSFSCSLVPGPQSTLHRLVWPEEEGPLVYCRRDGYGPAFQGTLPAPEQDLVVRAFLVVRPASAPGAGYAGLLDFAWRRGYRDQKPALSAERVWQLGVGYAKGTLYVEDRGFRGFSKGLWWKDGQWRLRPFGKYLVGWTGQNLSLANSLLADYQKTGDASSLTLAVNTVDSWCTAGMDNGLVHVFFDALLGDMEPGQELQDACNLAEAAQQLFEAEGRLKDCGVERPACRKVALGLCDFAVRVQAPDGRLGKSWHNDGSPADPEGTIGAYLIQPLVTAYRLTGRQDYWSAAIRAHAYYQGQLVHDGFTTAGALDTYCIDKESAIPLLTSGLALYEVTREVRYLDDAVRAAYYLATWQWHHTAPYPRDSPLGALGYDTFGGTSVSVQHHHIDPFALCFVPHWLKLARYTGNPVWAQRARAVWRNALVGISDGFLTINGKRRPLGSQDEGFYHTRWGFVPEQGSLGGVSEWLVAWPTGFRLATLRQLEDWSLVDTPPLGLLSENVVP